MGHGFGDHIVAQSSWRASAGRDEIIAAAERRYGEAYARWLARPQAALDGRRPVDLMGSEEGCVRVMRLLDSAHRW
jgi:uncharacterized protein (DUF2384 family)